MKIKGAIAFTRCPIGKWDREKDITQDQLSILRRLVNSLENTKVSHEQNVGLTNLYNEKFGMRKNVSSYGMCFREMVIDVIELIQSYED